MAKRIVVPFHVEGETEPIYIEVEQPPDSDIGVGEKVTEAASKSFNKALGTIKPIANAILHKAKSFNQPADEVEVKFGLKMSAEFGAVVASGNGEVNYEITLKWSRPQEQGDSKQSN